ncbi:hypothetical protein HOLleu_38954 [Holothuria leucospilota]|uniref:Uncharacterized protein n=1 Tax=Holothuria leucospilota TaxID=206669 RepID=A0A9Q1BCM1_HOLLE|nr:hypothetical protein HOLleu_38954 [Holothuria leucospilota]
MQTTPGVSENKAASITLKSTTDAGKCIPSAEGAKISLRFNIAQRARLKELPTYQAATLFKQYHLPVILRHPFCDVSTVGKRRVTSEFCEGILPPIMSQRQWKAGQGPLKDPLNKKSKVISIPMIDRKSRTQRTFAKLEAKGVKAKAFSKGKDRRNGHNKIK